MLDPNTKTDYNKMKMLLQLDLLDGDRKGVIRRVAEEGRMAADLYTSFPARELTNPDIFPSLLFYLWDADHSGDIRLSIVFRRSLA